MQAGLLKDGVLTLPLVLQKGNWRPEREDGDAIPCYAFGEGGKPLQVPGPAIRAPQGTTIDVTLHSFIGVPATVHGLHTHPGKESDVVTVAAGGSAHVRFVAGAPGTYLTGRERRTGAVEITGGSMPCSEPLSS